MSCIRLSRGLAFAIALFLTLPVLVSSRQATQVPVTGSPAAGLAVDTLLDLTVPADMLPAGPVVVTFGLYTWEAGATVSVQPGILAAGTEIDLVVEGAWAQRAGAAQLVARADGDGALEEIPADTEVVLGSGDGIAYPPEASFEFRNPDPRPGKAMWAAVTSTAPPTQTGEVIQTGFDFEFLGQTEPAAWADEAPGPLRVVFWQAVLAPGASISAPAPGGVQLVEAESGPGRARLNKAEDGSARNEGQAEQVVLGITLIPVDAEDAAP